MIYLIRSSFFFSTENGILEELLNNSRSSVTAVFISWRMSSWNMQSTSMRNRKIFFNKRRYAGSLKCNLASWGKLDSKYSLISSFSATYKSIKTHIHLDAHIFTFYATPGTVPVRVANKCTVLVNWRINYLAPSTCPFPILSPGMQSEATALVSNVQTHQLRGYN